MKSAPPVASGTANPKATNAIRNVPSSTAAIPNAPPSGCHADVVKNERPAALIALHDRTRRKSPITPISTSVRVPAPKVVIRKARSAPVRRVTGRTRCSSAGVMPSRAMLGSITCMASSCSDETSRGGFVDGACSEGV